MPLAFVGFCLLEAQNNRYAKVVYLVLVHSDPLTCFSLLQKCTTN